MHVKFGTETDREYAKVARKKCCKDSFCYFVIYYSFSSHWISPFNPLTPNDHYSGRTAPLTSKRCILYIYSTNIGTEYFKHGI